MSNLARRLNILTAADWWDKLSKDEQKAYLHNHPKSKVILKAINRGSKVYNIHLRETGEHIGHVSQSPQGHPFIDGVRLEKYKHTGLGRHIYNAFQHKIGRPLVPNPLGLSEDSTRVWQKRLAAMPPEHAKELLNDSLKAGLSYGIKSEHILDRLKPLLPDWQPPEK